MHRFFSGIFLFCMCFPFINIFGFNTDVQPNTIILGFLILVFNFKRLILGTIDRQLLMFLAFAMGGLLFSWNFDFLSLRIAIGLISILLNVFIVQNFVRRKDIKLVVIIAMHIYLLGGLIEYSGVDLSGLVGRDYQRVAEGGRGFSSLAPEPSFYAITVLLFLIYLHPFLTKRKWMSLYVFTIGALQIFVLARSGLGILLFIFLLLIRSSFRNALTVVCLGALLAIVSIRTTKLAHIRPVELAQTFMENGFELILLDGSMNLRISDILYSHLSVTRRPLGYGTLPWYEYLDQLETGRLLKSQQDRVMSFTGSFVYSYGIVSLFFFAYLRRRLRSLTRSFRNRRTSWLFMATLGLNSISITLPILHMLIAVDYEDIHG